MPMAAKERDLRKTVRTRPHSERGNFRTWVQLHNTELRNYCRSLAGSAWEGDDLAQDTWLKIWSATLGKGDDVQITRTYLYRTAQHAWIDRNRRKRLKADSLPVDELLQAPGQIDSADVWAAMETLVSELSPLQRTALLLMDILQYTAVEAAQLIQSTEGAVKAALHRARVRLRKAVEDSGGGEKNTSGEVPFMKEDTSPEGRYDVIVLAYLDAVRREDAAALALLYNDVRPQDVVPVLTLQSYRRNSLQSRSGSPASDPVQSRHMFMSFGLAA
ncbi:RNA polymerase sigma factor [Paenibacillus sp. MBLB2552]|uniref:RNA polymerase sigma factor n=1 Tax=Paenibacillus mellifer TaxID=2937794 RepID=A0A9X1Y3D8_9BACL|nr:RNA polymerase sigma factor [Paenibacillus mellifer]MCK8490179.1 RNA polymerase sigma factor [Paenibacillus mellifer]